MAGGTVEYVLRVSGEQAQASLAGVATAADRTTAAFDGSTKATGNYKAGLFSLQQQLLDVGTMLASGANPLTILALQGPQIATAAQQMGGFSSALGAVKLGLVAAAPYLAAATAAAVALGASYVIVANQTTTAATEARAHNEELIDQALAAARTSQEVDKLAKSWERYTDKAAEIHTQLAIINGDLDATTAASTKAAQSVRDLAEENIKAQAAEVSRLTTALLAAQNQQTTPGVSLNEVISAQAAERSLRARLEAAKSALDATRDQVDADAEAAASVAEYNDELRKSEEVLRAREAAQRKAAAAAEAWAREERRRAAEASRWVAEYVDGLGAGMFAPDTLRQGGLSLLSDVSMLDSATASTADLAIATADLAKALSTGAINAAEFDAAMTSLGQTQAASARVSGTAAGIGMVSQGPQAVVGAISNAGPWGALIAAIINLSDDFQGIGDMFHEFTININESIGGLGDMLGENLDRWLSESMQGVTDMIPNLVQGISDNLGNIIEAFATHIAEWIPSLIEMIVQFIASSVDMVRQLVDFDMWSDVGVAMAEGFLESFTTGKIAGEGGKVTAGSFFGGLGDILTGGLSGNIVGAAQSGKPFENDGPNYGRRNQTSSGGVHFHAPVLGLGVDGAQRVSDDMVTRGYLRTGK